MALPFVSPLVGGPSVNVWQMLVSWACVAGLLMCVSPARISYWLCLWLGTVALLVAWGGRHAPLAATLPASGVFAVAALSACVGARLARGGDRALRMLAAALLSAGLLSAVLGLLQYYGLTGPLVPWTLAPDLGQAYGNLRQRNQFATLISMAVLALLMLWATRRLDAGAWPWRVPAVAAMLLLVAAAAASTSRTGLLQLLGIIGVASWIARRERWPDVRVGANTTSGASATATATARRLPSPVALLAAIPLYFAISWLLPRLAAAPVEGMMQRLKTGAPDDHSRLILWHNVLDLIALRPWGGWGWGELSFAHYMTRYDGPRFVEILDNAHNLPLHLAVELGIPAAVAICGGFLWLVLTARPWREREPARVLAWGVVGLIVLHSLVEYPLWYGPFQLVFALCLGLLWPGKRAESKVRAGPVGALVLLVVVVYAGWDYTRISQIYLPRSERMPAYEDNTLSKISSSWLFAHQVEFARLTLTSVTRDNAAEVHATASRMLHFSPEPRVIVKLIESAQLLGRKDEVDAQVQRFRIAYPHDYARWLADQPLDRPPS